MVASRSRQGFLTTPSQARKLQLYNKKTGMVTPSFNYIFFDGLELSLKKIHIISYSMELPSPVLLFSLWSVWLDFEKNDIV